MIVASALFHWGSHGMSLVGDVPSGLPRLGLPNVAWSDVPLVLPVAFSCCIVILAQTPPPRGRMRFVMASDSVKTWTS